MAKRKSSGCSSDILAWSIVLGVIVAIADAITEHWKLILLIVGIILAITLIYFFRKNSDFIESAFVKARSSVIRGVKLDAGYYNTGYEISAGIYDVRCVKDSGSIKISPDFSLYLNEGKVFRNIRIPENSTLSIPTGMAIDLFNRRDIYDMLSQKDTSNIAEKEADADNTVLPLPSNIDTMDGHDFEYFCADVMKKNGFDTAEVTRGSGDHGADIIATRNNVRYAVQCKRWSSAVGNKVVQDIFYAKEVYHCHVGIIITNNTFTPAAQEAAQEAGIVLWDGKFLKKYIEKCSETTCASEVDNESSNQKEEENQMYDVEKGIYPPGHYVAGKTLPLGGYVLKARKDKQGSITYYNTLDDLIHDENACSYYDFDEDFFVSLFESGKHILIENADIQKVN